MYQLALRLPPFSRRSTRIALLLLVALGALLYLEWRSTRAPAAAAGRAADTMCIAARIGLPCRP